MGKWIRIAVWYGFFIYGAVTGRWGIMAVSLLFAAVPTWRICAGKWRDRRIQTMWDRFAAGSPEAADAALQIWTLPAGGKDLAERVRRGEISGESFSVDYFTRHDRPLPQPGAFYVLCGRDRSPICVVQTVSVERCRFAEVTDRLAAIEGYPDAGAWKTARLDRFREVWQKIGLEDSPENQVLFEQFRVAYFPGSHIPATK